MIDIQFHSVSLMSGNTGTLAHLARNTHELIYDELRREFQDSPIRFYEEGQQRLIDFLDRLKGRVKKMTSAGIVSNLDTPQNSNFQNQVQLELAEEFSRRLNINLGYSENEDTEEIIDVIIAAPKGRRNEWVMKLRGEGNIVTVRSLFEQTTQTNKPRTKIKKGAQKRKMDGTTDES